MSDVPLPSSDDVLVFELVTRDLPRWLVSRGEARLFECADQRQALQIACAIATEMTVQCFLADDEGVRRIESADYPVLQPRRHTSVRDR